VDLWVLIGGLEEVAEGGEPGGNSLPDEKAREALVPGKSMIVIGHVLAGARKDRVKPR